ncbi:ankyrin repeat domain-containing protein [Tenacibaculum sp. SG-28]|uniref:ankyrin repeat domain-containing protein n=1 Tax=Tenacibaculum sp. SG-28 TaxID=754426 RepID=UPI001E328897|nr:ankyrin repeat domain-containing protein [Tenacibaculum sp. SG-28]
MKLNAQDKNIFLDRAFWKTAPSIATIKTKISEGNDPTALNRYAFDAVGYAILEEAPNSSIHYLLSLEGNPIDKITHDKRTYVFWAAYKGNVALMEYLIGKNARMDLKDSHGYSVLTFAAATGQKNTKVYDLCLENGSSITETDDHGANALLLIMPHLNDLKMLDYFTEKGLRLSSKDNDGNGAFNYGTKNGNSAILKELIAAGVPYKGLNNNGGNAMFMATQRARKGYNLLSFYKELEALGVAPNIVNKQGKTPLHNIAYANKDKETIAYFIEKGTNINQEDIDGNTPLLNASSVNSLEVITLLIDDNTDINHQNKQGKTAISNAIERNSMDVVSYLLKQGAKTNVKDQKGNSLAYYLVHGYNAQKPKDFQDKKSALIAKGVPMKEVQHNANTLFHIGLEKNSIALLKEIHAMGIDVNAINSDGLTVLHKAVMQAKDLTVVNYLLSIGADKTMVTSFGENVFDLAKENEQLNAQNIDLTFLK